MIVFKWILIVGLVLIVGLALLVFTTLKLMAPPDLKTDLDDPSASQKLDQHFTELYKGKRNKFNGVVLVRKGSKTLIKKSFGTDGFGRSLSPDAPMRLASVSKQFTAAGILTLVENGQVDLDAKISNYLPDCQYSATVRSLLNHTSGIPDTYMKMPKNEVVTNATVEDWVCSKGSTLKKSEQFKYSNTGYVLLARIIERVSGESFEAYMKSAVFDPLGMKKTRVFNRLSADDFPERAVGFDASATNIKPVSLSHLDGVAGDGGVFSSLTDLENWARFWTDERLISAGLKSQAMKGAKNDYGFGLICEGDVIWHNGAWLATNSYFYLNTRNDNLIAIIDNGSHFMLGKIAQNMRRLIEQ